MSSNTKEQILQQLADHPILLYMKGVPSAPECGFSAKTADLLNATQVPYTYVNVLKAPFIREKLPQISKWPTFPQLFVNGELVGGCDIIEAMDKEGSLLPLLKTAIQVKTEAEEKQLVAKSEVETLISKEYPGAQIIIEGEGCDLTISIVSDRFAGQTMMKQHQGVMATLSELLANGRLHAVILKTYKPEQWERLSVNPVPGLLQIQL